MHKFKATYSFLRTHDLNNFTPDTPLQIEENLVLPFSHTSYCVTNLFPQADLSHSRSSDDTDFYLFTYQVKYFTVSLSPSLMIFTKQ